MHGDLKGVRFCFSICCISVGCNLTISPLRITFLLMSRVAHDSVTLGSSASRVSAACLGSRYPTDGWRPSSSAPTTERNLAPPRESDSFALAMVTFEVRIIYRGGLFHDSETPFCTLLQVFIGQVPFAEYNGPAMVMKKIADGERPPRPSEGRKLGLSGEFWELVQSSLAHEADKRPQVDAFVEFLEQANPNIAMLEELTEFDAHSEDDTQRLRHMFGYEDNTLFGM